MNPRDIAIDLIRVYVERGDSLASLKSGQQGRSCSEYSCAIGGYAEDKRYSSDNILVTRVNGKDCLHVFKLKDIFNEILSGQQKLFA